MSAPLALPFPPICLSLRFLRMGLLGRDKTNYRQYGFRVSQIPNPIHQRRGLNNLRTFKGRGLGLGLVLGLGPL